MSYPFTEKALLLIDALWDTDTLIEGIKTQVFNEIDAIYLDGIDLSPELHPLGFLAPDNRTD